MILGASGASSPSAFDVYFTTFPVPIIVELKPATCPEPAPYSPLSRGVLPIALVGSSSLDVMALDHASLRVAGVLPLSIEVSDVAGDSPSCAEASEPDGIADLLLKASNEALTSALGPVESGDIVTIDVTGHMSAAFGENRLIGNDDVVIVGEAH